ncbi:MAG: helix-turn-helix domain-containing protein, partial [Flavisolibacter sp.]
MSAHQLQLQLFQYLKNKMAPETPMVDEMAALLEISTDSAYRRLRGEKALSLEEVYKICVKYKLSLDGLLNLQTDAFVFTGNFVQAESFRFDEYLKNIVGQVKYMNSFKERKMYYLCKDIPIFHHFHYREIAAFKYYFWMK